MDAYSKQLYRSSRGTTACDYEVAMHPAVIMVVQL